MADKTKIGWTDASWNPVVGCSKVSPGCDNCYAERMAVRLSRMECKRAGGTYKYARIVNNRKRKWTGKTYCDESALDIPLHWKKPRRVFVCSMSDLFHPGVPFEFIASVFGSMFAAPQHTYQILTKRPERLLEFIPYLNAYLNDNCYECGDITCWSEKPNKNIWLGVTAENQEQADKRIPILLQIPAAVRFVSIEPMLGAVDLGLHLKMRKCGGCGYIGHQTEYNQVIGTKDLAFCHNCGLHHTYTMVDGIDWVIVGGESGPGARPMHPDWVRSIRDQCREAGVPFFFKQWGEWLIAKEVQKTENSTLHLWGNRATRISKDTFFRVGKKKAGRLLDGKEYSEYPVMNGGE